MFTHTRSPMMNLKPFECATVCLLAVTLCLLSVSARADLLANPTITAASPEFGDAGFNDGVGTFDVSHVFDDDRNSNYGTEYASATQGVNTFIEYDFGSTVTIGGMSHINRNTNDAIDQSRLIFSSDATFGNGDDTSIVLDHLAQTGSQSNEFRFAPMDAQYVRWEMVSVSGPTNNQGSRYIRFHDASEVGRHDMTHIATTGNFDNNTFNAIHAYDGIANGGADTEWASNGQGTNTQIDFDLGTDRKVGGFVYVQRDNDYVTSANLIFANDAAFTDVVGVRGVNLNTGDFARTAVEFGGTSARYVRFDVTATAGGGPNPGASNMYFVPSEITPVSATASTFFSPDQDPVNLINDSGFGTDRGIGAVHDNNVGAGTMWHSSGGVVDDESLLFDLGVTHSQLEAAIVWNHNQAGLTERGVDEMEILVSPDNVSFTSLGLFNLDEAGGVAGEPGQWLQLDHVGHFRYVRFDINSAISGATNEFVGLSEVRFIGVVPTPAALPAGLSLLAVMLVRRSTRLAASRRRG